MTFIYISTSLKTSYNLENKCDCGWSDCTINVHNDLSYELLICNLNETQQRYHIKSKNFKQKKYNLVW